MLLYIKSDADAGAYWSNRCLGDDLVLFRLGTAYAVVKLDPFRIRLFGTAGEANAFAVRCHAETIEPPFLETLRR